MNPRKQLPGTVVLDPELLSQCEHLHAVIYERDTRDQESYLYPDSERIDAFAKLWNIFKIQQPQPAPLAPGPLAYWSNASLLRMIRASKRAILIDSKGLAIGTKVYSGRKRTPAEIVGTTWDYLLRIRFLDSGRKASCTSVPPHKLEKLGGTPLSVMPVEEGANPNIVVLERASSNSWRAYFQHKPNTWGVGKSQAEATGSLYVQSIGAIILEDPSRFNIIAITKPISSLVEG